MRQFPFTFEEASKRQYRYHSRYSVWLVAPDGRRSYLSYTSRKSMQSLQSVLHNKVSDKMERDELEKIMSANLDDVRYTKSAGSLHLSNGWKVSFGGTVLQEAQERVGSICS